MSTLRHRKFENAIREIARGAFLTLRGRAETSSKVSSSESWRASSLIGTNLIGRVECVEHVGFSSELRVPGVAIFPIFARFYLTQSRRELFRRVSDSTIFHLSSLLPRARLSNSAQAISQSVTRYPFPVPRHPKNINKIRAFLNLNVISTLSQRYLNTSFSPFCYNFSINKAMKGSFIWLEQAE